MEGAFVEPSFNRGASPSSKFGRIGGAWIAGFQSGTLHTRQRMDDKFELTSIRLNNSFTEAIKSDSFTALGDRTNIIPDVGNNPLSKFGTKNKTQNGYLKSPKQHLLRRSKTFREIPKIQPAPQRKVVIHSEHGTAIINGNEEPALIPKLDLRNLNQDNSDSLRLPIARRGILQQNDEVQELLLKSKGIQYSQIYSWSLGSQVSSEESAGSSESFCEIPEDCPPTQRGDPLLRSKSLCVTDDKQPIDLDLKIAFDELQNQNMSRSFSLVPDSSHIPRLIESRDLE